MRHSQKLKELERRRRRGARLLAGGESQAEVARRVGVSRQTVMRWDRARQEGGMEALTPGAALRTSGAAQRGTTPGAGAAAQRRGAGGRFLNGVMDAPRIAQLIETKFCRETGPLLGLAVARTAGLERAAADGPGAGTRRASGSHVEGQEVAGTKKIAARQGRVIVFIDESGLSERPCRARTWAPKGQTPVLQYSFSWKQLSVIAGLSYWRFYFRLFNGSIKSPQIVEFLKALQATIGKKLLIIWDRLQAHRSKLVKAHVEAQRGQIAIDYLPAYAPDMNPVECIWGYLKHHAMPNYCARDLGDVAHRARSNLRSMQRRPTLVTAFWKQVDLF